MSDKTFEQVVGEAIGEASMCWSETPKGVFYSTRALGCAQRIIDYRNKKLELESAILGHIDAMRVLLKRLDEL